MSDPLRTDTSRALEPGSKPERDARAEAERIEAQKTEARKIEELLLAGLDHYFACRYEQAINVWTRALFFDRGHARAHAYIERARSALAERQRESEELLQNGLAAFGRGDADTARRLLQTAIARGAPSDEALAVLGRLDRLEPGRTGAARSGRQPGHQRWLRAADRSAEPRSAVENRPRSSREPWLVALALSVAAVVIVLVATAARFDWSSLLDLQRGTPPSQAAAPPFVETAPELPRRGQMALDRARTLVASGRLRDALELLDRVRPADPERADADRLRADVQKELLALAGLLPAGSGRETGHLGQP
jgi:tetratricopeptide (TPR) repeat protein